jgi:D-alanyl-D-alanine carboxypeptidase (penicillin-binding protein 5/6)
MWWRWWLAFGGVSVLLQVGLAPRAGAVAASPLSPSTILIDAYTGQTLSEQDADAPRPTAGLGQLMVLLLTLEQAEMGALPLAAPVTVSPLAAGLGSAHTRIPLHTDKTYILGDLVKAMVVGAAADAAMAVAEAIAGSIPACLELMNARAQRLGMAATHYGNFVADESDTVAGTDATTARDVARLAQALVRRESILQWASLSGLPFDHGATLLRNANQLLGTVRGVDGLLVTSLSGADGRHATGRRTTGRRTTGRRATGRRAAFGMVATAQRESLRLIAVVLGAPDSAIRYSRAAELLDWGFAHYERLDVVKEGERLNLEVRVVNGVAAQLTPVAGQAVSLLRRRDEERDLQIRYQVPTVIGAPVQRHQVIGELIVEEHGQLLAVVPVVSPKTVAAGSVLSAALR